jgi:hypothetical protein
MIKKRGLKEPEDSSELMELVKFMDYVKTIELGPCCFGFAGVGSLKYALAFKGVCMLVSQHMRVHSPAHARSFWGGQSHAHPMPIRC